MAHQNTIETIQFDGGVLCFDFINTVKSRKVPDVHNYLATYADFITWCRRADFIPERTVAHLEAYSIQNPTQTATALESIMAARENLYAIFSAIAAETIPEPAALTTFNHHLAKALSHVSLQFRATDFLIQLDIAENDLAGPLAPIFYSAYQTLTQQDRKRIKECAECGWLFLDTTKNGKRQWCNPGDCGSTSKARRYYYRQKEKEQKQ